MTQSQPERKLHLCGQSISKTPYADKHDKPMVEPNLKYNLHLYSYQKGSDIPQHAVSLGGGGLVGIKRSLFGPPDMVPPKEGSQLCFFKPFQD